MSKNNRLVIFLILLLQIAGVAVAKSSSMLMSEALRLRAIGKMEQAEDGLINAVDLATNPMEKNLALSMLGDTQMELHKYTDAAATFERLLYNLNDGEEKAEAIFWLIKANLALNNDQKVASLMNGLKNNYSKTPYVRMAEAIITVKGFDTTSRQATASVPKARPVTPVQITGQALVEGTVPHPETKLAPFNQLTPESYMKTALEVKILEGAAQQEVISEILKLQDSLKNNSRAAGMDLVLFELAEKCLLFGEIVESCQTFDRLLQEHPQSELVEHAYYEAIRLRAVVGVFEAVITWSDAFMQSFPNSTYLQYVLALKQYAQLGGKIDLTHAVKAPLPREPLYFVKQQQVVKQSPQIQDVNSIDIIRENSRLEASSQYKEASRKMKDGKYNLALLDFQRLANNYPNAPKIWWEIALIHIQSEEFSKAEGAIRRMLRLDPNDQEANSLLGYILYRQNNYDQAADVYNRTEAPEGEGINFFDGKSAAERLKQP